MKKGADALCLDMALEKGYLGSDLSVSAEFTDFHRNNFLATQFLAWR